MEDKSSIDRITEALSLLKSDLVSIKYTVFHQVVIEKRPKYLTLPTFELGHVFLYLIFRIDFNCVSGLA